MLTGAARSNCYIVDATGVGAPVLELLRSAGRSSRVTAVTITGGERACGLSPGRRRHAGARGGKERAREGGAAGNLAALHSAHFDLDHAGVAQRDDLVFLAGRNEDRLAGLIEALVSRHDFTRHHDGNRRHLV